MESLRNYGATLCGYFGSTRDALYERQRLLIRGGMLELEGRGRGGGSKATPRNVALLVISQMATDTLAGSEANIRATAAAKRTGGISSLLPGVATFLDGLEMVLSSVSLAEKTGEAVISRTSPHPRLMFNGPLASLGNGVKCNIPKGLSTLEFSLSKNLPPSYRVEARLETERLVAIARDLEGMAE